MELSKRLAAIAAMAEPGDRLADIGTDHGYLPIYLVEQNIAPSAIAMDVVEGPLARAFAHVREHGLEEKIVLRKSDGFEKLLPGEADAAVIAGMGGPLMIRILEEGKKTAESLKYLILSPQSDIPAVRRYLAENRYETVSEAMALEDGKYYTVMKVLPGAGTGGPLPYIEEKYGKCLLRKRDPVLFSWLIKERETLDALRVSLLQAGSERAKERLAQVERELETAAEAIRLYKGGEGCDQM